MNDEPGNFALQYLRRMDTNMDRMGDDLRDIKGRLIAVEETVVGVERRLDLVEPPH